MDPTVVLAAQDVREVDRSVGADCRALCQPPLVPVTVGPREENLKPGIRIDDGIPDGSGQILAQQGR